MSNENPPTKSTPELMPGDQVEVKIIGIVGVGGQGPTGIVHVHIVDAFGKTKDLYLKRKWLRDIHSENQEKV